MGLRDYRGYEQVKPQREKSGVERKRSKELYLRKQARKKKIKDKKLKNSVLLVAMLLFITGAITISRDMKIYNAKSEINKLKADSKLIMEKNEDLKIKLLKNSSLEKIEKIAKEKLNMVKPESDDIMDFNNIKGAENNIVTGN